MILYHGTNLDIDKIDLEKCAPYRDFGKGFYTTTILDQAKAMAIRKSRIFGGNPCIVSYDAPDNLLQLKTVKIKNFPSTSKEWAIVLNCWFFDNIISAVYVRIIIKIYLHKNIRFSRATDRNIINIVTIL